MERNILEFLNLMFMGVYGHNVTYVSDEFFNELTEAIKPMLRFTNKDSSKYGFQIPEIRYLGNLIRKESHPESPKQQEIMRKLKEDMAPHPEPGAEK